MTPERLDAIEKLFHEARERTPDERAAFLAAACADDSDLRREVESLLAQGPGGVIDSPVAVLAAGLVLPSSPRLAPGASLGPYRIDRLLGVGGMGEVYRARDTTLGRDVAIKILPREFTADAGRLSRFEREARLLAALNHPHIAAIYGVAEGDGVRGLVLELVEGPTLADRLTAGPIPIDEALGIAHQTADALEAAHEKGVVHRDLKPANIKVTPEGVVKVIDFGLGKMIEPDATARDRAGSPPALSAATKSGLIVGTATYMSPEQARGRPADTRADIWAFGCVLFEMLTGANPFHAQTAPDALARILEREPDWNALPAKLPAAIRRLVQRCLKKNPADRLHDIADARLEIADALSSPESSETNPRHTQVDYRPWIGAAAAAMAVVAAALLVRALATGPQPTTGVLEFPINVNDSGGLGVAVSPNGRQVAFSTFAVGGPQIWRHFLDSGVTRAMPGGAGGVTPFWSPDGAAIGFFALDGKLKRIDVADGSTTVIGDANYPAGGSWNGDGVILFSASSSLFRVSSAGGPSVPVEIADDDVGEKAIRTYPQFLPDGRRFIYHASGSRGVDVRVASLDSRETKHLVEADYPAVYAAPSHLLFLRGAVLMAQAFNPKTFTLEGAASAVASDAAPGYLIGPPGRLAQFSASASVLALMKARGGVAAQLAWFDRAGNRSSAIEQPPNVEYLNPAISPDGTRLAVNRMDPVTGNWDIWIVDLARNISSRLTSDPGQDGDPVWSADSKEIVFASNRGGRYGVYRKAVDGSGSEELLATIEGRFTGLSLSDWSPDGRFVLYNVGTEPIFRWDMWALPLFGDRRPFPVFRNSFVPFGARFSPDGNWIAYSSLETGAYEVHVQRFMTAGDKKQISRGGGAHPRWTSGGREIVYWAPPGGIASVDVDLSSPNLRVSAPKTLISAAIPTLIDGRTHYDVTRDGRRFLLRQPAGTERPAITVMVNWTQRLTR